MFNKYPVVFDRYPLVTTYWILFIIYKMYPEKELSQVQQDYLVDVIMTWIQKEIEGQEHKI